MRLTRWNGYSLEESAHGEWLKADEVRAVLLKYGGHLGGCADPYSQGQLKCDCGWSDILTCMQEIAP